MEYNLDSFGVEGILNEDAPGQINDHHKSLAEKYGFIKKLHGEMHSFSVRLLSATAAKQDIERIEQLIAATRNIMYAAKNIADAQHDINQMRNSSNDIKFHFFTQAQDKTATFYRQVPEMLNGRKTATLFEELSTLYKAITGGYTETMHSLYKSSISNQVSEVEISTLINFNRQLYTSFKSILFGLKDYLLNAKEAGYFENLPGFIR